MIEFQHTAARRRLHHIHSATVNDKVSFNTQPRGGGCAIFPLIFALSLVSTHSRAEAAAPKSIVTVYAEQMFQHTAARRRLRLISLGPIKGPAKFQHTAARRRLHRCASLFSINCTFQHTAARRRLHLQQLRSIIKTCFNTQPRGGGCSLPKKVRKISVLNIVFR